MKPHRRLPSPALAISLIALTAAMGGSALALPGKNQVDSHDIQKGAVNTRQIARHAVTSAKLDTKSVKGGKLAGKSVKGGKIRDKAVKTSKLDDQAVTTDKLADGAVTGPKVADDSIGDAKLSDSQLIPLTKVTATDGASFDNARNAAPPQELFKKGPLTLYAKCFTDTSATRHLRVHLRRDDGGGVHPLQWRGQPGRRPGLPGSVHRRGGP